MKKLPSRSHAARVSRAILAAIVAIATIAFPTAAALAATVPGGFIDTRYVALPTDVTAMQFAPDGRLFVSQQTGKLRIVQDGRLLATPFATLPVDARGERGLLGVAFDPDFARNGWVYVYYTASSPVIRNRISRLTASGNVAVAGSERVLFELDPLSSALNHNGGAIHVGNDGKLYVAVGDNVNSQNAQSFGNLFGKILRLNRDGSIPSDNPFLQRTTGRNRAIWALGLRNPFTTTFQRSTGRLFINDVGQDTYEEVNVGIAGANFGWPYAEGPSADTRYKDPLHFYGHTNGACAITGGAFYAAPVMPFPSGDHGKYFFADYCGGWIRRLDPTTGAVTAFASGIAQPVDLEVGRDGALYYLSRSGAYVGRISYGASLAPEIDLQPASRTIAVGESVTFRVGASGTGTLQYQWRRNGNPISGATGASYTRNNVTLADSGAFFDVVVSNSFGRVASEPAQLTVVNGTRPVASITRPISGATYAAGTTVEYAGAGNDAEDGALPASAFTWWVDLHHDGHTHPHMPPMSGRKSGSFWIPATGETAANVFYRIHLRVVDSTGLARATYRDLQPRRTTVTLNTYPTNLLLRLDGRLVRAPYRFVGVEGMRRDITAVTPQSADGRTWVFGSWSDGGTRSHTIRTPVADTTYTARFVVQ
jgi:glucose/arabinose dehydrogenase